MRRPTPVLIRQAVLSRVCRGGRPRGEPELHEDVRDVAVDGVLAKGEPCGDLSVAQPLGDEPEDLGLAPGQRLRALTLRACGRGFVRGNERTRALAPFGCSDRLEGVERTLRLFGP